MWVIWCCCDCSWVRAAAVVIQSRNSQGVAVKAVFTVPETVGCDARYTGAGYIGRMQETVGCARDTVAKLPRGRVGKSVESNGYITSRDADP